ncbi:hypothetical protein WDU94_010354 [Cyamophila willieti]
MFFFFVPLTVIKRPQFRLVFEAGWQICTKVSCCVPYLQVTCISNFKSLALTILEISFLRTRTHEPLSQTNFFGRLAGPASRFLPKVSCCVPYLQVTFISNFKSLALTVLEIS